MSEFNQIVFAIAGYRVLTILIGLAFAYFGYKLFVLGIYEKAGDLKAAWGGRSLVVRQAAPGTFFALFGVTVIAIALIRGVDIERARKMSSGLQSSMSLYRLSPVTEAQIQPIMQKIANGETPTENERKILGQWVGWEERLKLRMEYFNQ